MQCVSSSKTLFTPVMLGPYRLPNRIVMAPLTRMRSGAGNVPRALNAEYYRQRASAGLIISEGAPVSPFGHGYYRTPGIHTREQAEGWRAVTGAVHAAEGRIYLQLWHTGRMSHPDLLPGGASPVAPSAFSAGEEAWTEEGPKPHPVPRALTTDEVKLLVKDFRHGAELGALAGFDGVELHGANGYLLEQFLADGANTRADEYGGSIENRARLLLEATRSVMTVWGPDRVGIRLSPANRHGSISDSNRLATWSYAVRELAKLEPAYLHLVEPRVDDSSDVSHPDLSLASSHFRQFLKGETKLISAGGHSYESGTAAIQSGDADLVAYGRLFVANPDLPRRFACHAPLNPYNRATFYGGDAEGYTDYPFLP